MKRFLLITMILVSLVLLAGCQSKFEKLAKEAQDIKITVDQQTLKETQKKIQEVQDQLNGK